MSGPAEAVPADEAEPEAVDDEAQYEPADRARQLAVVLVFDVAVQLPATHALVTVREVDEPHRLFAIPVGLPEGTALAHAWRGIATPRPLTHELFADVLVRLGATIDAVRLSGRRAGVVLAEMELDEPPRPRAHRMPPDRRAHPRHPPGRGRPDADRRAAVRRRGGRRAGLNPPQVARVKARSPGWANPELRSAWVEEPSSEIRIKSATST